MGAKGVDKMTTDEANVNSEVDHTKRVAREKIVELLESPYFTHDLFEMDKAPKQMGPKTDSNVPVFFILLRCLNVLRDDLLDWAKNDYVKTIEAMTQEVEAMTRDYEVMRQRVEAYEGKDRHEEPRH
jgi:hypothetical protein